MEHGQRGTNPLTTGEGPMFMPLPESDAATENVDEQPKEAVIPLLDTTRDADFGPARRRAETMGRALDIIPEDN